MKKILGGILTLLAVACAAVAAPQVRVESGRVAGDTIGDLERFLGIPYAAPPVGQLRWRAPQPVRAWQGVRKATQHGNDCMQEPYPSDAAPLGTTPAEDCLVMNVWKPTGAKAGDNLPVLVWIYGGGNVNGGASPSVYDGESFARNGVVFVSFNWRVGRFGFFAFPELTKQNPDNGLLANYGYLDSIAALRWVQKNVAAFGGDPKQVTIYGQSAGAGQVQMLLTSPMAEGLFARAIIQSGGGAGTERPAFQGAGTGPISIEQAGVNFAKRWGIQGTGADALKQLRALTAEQVTDGIRIEAGQPNNFIGPVVDGRILTGSLVKAVDAGRAAKVPLLIGSTTADNSRIDARTLDEAFAKTFASVADRARAAYLTDPKADPAYVLREMGRDLSYNESVRYVATKLTAQGLPVYTYRFGYVANAMRQEWKEGPPHATDIPFSMNTVRAKYGDQVTSSDIAMSYMVHKYWVNFVRTGNPNGAGLPQWPAYDPRADVIMTFAPDGIPRAISDPYKARIDAVAASLGRR